MAVSAGTAYVDIVPSFKKFSRELNKQIQGAGSGLKKFGDKLSNAGNKLTVGLTLPLVALGKVAFDAASGLNEQISKTNVVFGKSAKSVQAWSETTIDALGLSRRHALEAVGTFGNLFVGMKLGEKPAAEMSERLVELASDLASFNDVPIEEALAALRSGLVGETEPLRKFAVNLNDAALRQKALELGLVKTTKEVLPPAIKAQASYALILEQTKTAQGDYARTADSAANQQRKLKEQFDEAAATIGQRLLPIGVKLIGFASDLLKKFEGLSPGTQDLVLKLGLAAVALGPVVKLAGTLSKTLGVLKKGFTLAGAAIGKFTGKKLAEKTALEANNKAATAGTTAVGGLGGAVKKLGPALAVATKVAGSAAAMYAVGTVATDSLAVAHKRTSKQVQDFVREIKAGQQPVLKTSEGIKGLSLYLQNLAKRGESAAVSAIKLAVAEKYGASVADRAAMAAEQLLGTYKPLVVATDKQTAATNKLVAAMGKIPPVKNIKITTTGMKAALSNLNALREVLGDVGSVGITLYSNKLPGFAAGGSFTASMARRGFWTGEEGPEFIRGGSGGTVIANHDLGDIPSLASAYAGATFQFYIQSSDPHGVAREVEQVIDKKLNAAGQSASARIRLRSRIGARP